MVEVDKVHWLYSNMADQGVAWRQRGKTLYAINVLFTKLDKVTVIGVRLLKDA